MKDNEEQYNILAEDEKQEEQHRQIGLILLFSLCFLFVCLTSTFSIIHYTKIGKPDPVIDIDDTSSTSSSSSYIEPKPPKKKDPIEPIVSSTETSSTSSSKEISSSSEISSSQEEPPAPPEEEDDGTTKVIKVIYYDGTEIKSESGTLPGWVSSKKKIKVTNMSNVDLEYNIVWTNVHNEFTRKDDFVYHVLINGREQGSGTLPSNKKVLVNNVEIAKNASQTLEIYVEYKNLNLDQSVDMNKTFYGTILIDNVD